MQCMFRVSLPLSSCIMLLHSFSFHRVFYSLPCLLSLLEVTELNSFSQRTSSSLQQCNMMPSLMIQLLTFWDTTPCLILCAQQMQQMVLGLLLRLIKEIGRCAMNKAWSAERKGMLCTLWSWICPGKLFKNTTEFITWSS